MNSCPTRIKPLLTHQITLKSLYTYQDFLRKRPKKALTFRLSAQGWNFEQEEEWNFGFSKSQCKQIQLKLFKALELAKPIRKIDLSDFTLGQDYFRKSKLSSVLRKTSRVKTVYLDRTLRGYEKEICIEGYLKYLKEIQYLKYQLTGSNPKLTPQNVNDRDCEYPLKYLRYCLKLQKLLLSDDMRYYGFNFDKTSHKSPSDSIQKNYMINNLLLTRPFPIDSIRKFFHEMTSFMYCIYGEQFENEPQQNSLNLIRELSNLQEIHFIFQDSMIESLEDIFQLIAEKGSLNKVKLDFNFAFPKLEKILKILSPTRLISFSLKTVIKENRVLASITQLLQGMNQLEYLRLDISHQTSFNNSSTSLNEICQEITKLDKLQHLKLAFNAKRKVSKEQRLPNFLSDIYPIFAKPIKLKTLSISCNQVDHSEAFPEFIAALQNLHTSLHKLKIDIGIPSRSPNSHNIAANLTRSLSNIKVLKLPCLSVNASRGLNLMIEAVSGLKFLEEFMMGEIDEKVDVIVLLNFIERILCKAGLRKFYCQLTRNLRKKIKAEIKDLPQYNHDFKKFLKANPCLEVAHFSRYEEGLEFTSEIHNWSSYKIPYCDLFSLHLPISIGEKLT